MNCEKVMELIALDATGDTTAQERALIASHVSSCDHCRAFASEFAPIALASLRGVLPLTASDFAAVRRNVLAATEERHSGALRFRFALAAVVILIAAVTLVMRRESAIPQSTTSVAQTTTVAPPVTKLEPPVVVATMESVPVVTKSVRAARPRVTRRAPRPTPPPQTAETDGAALRLEFQTADPDIRIIWIANSKLEEETDDESNTR